MWKGSSLALESQFSQIQFLNGTTNPTAGTGPDAPLGSYYHNTVADTYWVKEGEGVWVEVSDLEEHQANNLSAIQKLRTDVDGILNELLAVIEDVPSGNVEDNRRGVPVTIYPSSTGAGDTTFSEVVGTHTVFTDPDVILIDGENADRSIRVAATRNEAADADGRLAWDVVIETAGSYTFLGARLIMVFPSAAGRPAADAVERVFFGNTGASTVYTDATATLLWAVKVGGDGTPIHVSSGNTNLVDGKSDWVIQVPSAGTYEFYGATGDNLGSV